MLTTAWPEVFMSFRGVAVATALAALLSACGSAKTEATAPSGVGTGCVACHGSFDNSAPPVSLSAGTATSDLAVGAHQTHLHPGPFRKAVDCDECHTVPASVGAPGHIDRPGAARTPADVAFGALARADGATPVWDRVQAGCAATYCHGGTLAGGSNNAPTWTRVGGNPSQVSCGTCHGVPPPTIHTGTAHPTVPACASSPPSQACTMACSACHPGTVMPDGAIDIAGGLHIDGFLEVGARACAVCHGDPARSPPEISAAPPRDTAGNTSATAVGVGAHLAHVVAGVTRGPIPCGECHTVPSNLDARVHPKNSGSVDITWGPLAKAGGAAPIWTRAPAPSCAATYCHGATLTGGKITSPSWTAAAGGSPIACDACHGVPPPTAVHRRPDLSLDTDCGRCHSGYTATAVDKTIHVNGFVEVGAARCTSCHGDARRVPSIQAAPPTDVGNRTDTGAIGVGAHMQHLDGSLTKLRGPMPCTECHAPVTSTDHSTGDLAVEMAFGPLATADGAHPAWDHASAGCASTYCHGATLAGGDLKNPIWTKVDGSQAKCGTCHGVPPPAPHVPRADCGTCHTGYTTTVVNLATHVNGVLDAITLRCTTCHGDATAPAPIAAAPPRDNAGNGLPTARGVGAHQKHLRDGVLRAAILCTECHVVPTVANHADGTVDVAFGPLARSGAASPVWNGASLTCSASYCHGATLGGGRLKTPRWTQVDGTQAACGTCHGIPPPAPHVQSASCGGCHTGYTDRTVNLATHIDGTLQATGGCTSCHGDAARTPASIASAPPKPVNGLLTDAVNVPGVGAHQAHLVAGKLTTAIACTECHAVPTDLSSHPSGALDLTWGPIARAGGVTPTYAGGGGTCANYCHGSSMPGGTNKTPTWASATPQAAAAQAACGTCHGAPPANPTHSGVTTACAPCHAAAYSSTAVDKALHVNGVIDASGASCTSCHGDPARAPAAIAAAPPKPVGGNVGDPTTVRGVGSHLAHLVAGKMRDPMACNECHAVPATLASPGHNNGATEIVWGPLARTGGAVPAWNGTAATPTCSNTYCHGARLPNAATNGTNHSPSWSGTATALAAQAACGTCHGIPPPAPHSQNTACGSCHTGYSATAVNRAQHVDGTVQAASMTCTSCHGDPARVLVTGADAQARSAPPVDTLGRTGNTVRSVGAHVAHLNRGALGAPVACTECHPVPSSMTHANGTVTVAFGTLAKTRTSNPTWNTTTLGCAATYCHGQGLKGGSKPTPVWTATGGLGCTTCHAAPPVDNCHPPAFNHPGGNSCSSCHRDVNSAGTAITNARLHVNGVVNGLCADCHGTSETRNCN